MKEEELRDLEAPWPKTEEELLDFVRKLADRKHDYGTCVYAVSLATTAMFNYMASKLGITGFQSGCADLDVLKRIRGMKHGFSVIDYGNLLYPQYLSEEHFPSIPTLIERNKKDLQESARKLLEEQKTSGIKAHPDVVKHWESFLTL